MSTHRRRNVAKLLARLNPKIMPLEASPGHSTAPSVETAIDIAAALGAAGQGGAKHRLAVTALCLRWWPSLIEGPAQVMGHVTVNKSHVVTKFSQKGRERVTQRWVDKQSVEAPTETPAFRRMADLIAFRLRRRIELDRARGVGVPLDDALAVRVLADDFLHPWARLVIHEYRHPNHCPTCTSWGRPGEVPDLVLQNGKATGVTWKVCDNCDGQGVMAWSGNRRAKAMHIRAVTWADFLNVHHAGALTLLRELEWRGALLVVRRLGQD